MLTVACVLRSGGEYFPRHVEHLARCVKRNLLNTKYRFVCLTDIPAKMPKDVEGILLPDIWPHWWGKICLFKKNLLEGPIFFLDLDTIIVSQIDDIVINHQFTVLENFWGAHRGIGSGLMAWNCDLSHIYDAFKKSPNQFIEQFRTRSLWGDQAFIQMHSKLNLDYWQHKHPNRIVSWKMHCKHGVPKDASIVCYHGQPRPWNSSLWGELDESKQA